MRDVDANEYSAQVELVGLFLDGRHDELVEDLERRMDQAATSERYELAAVYRDQIRSVERVRTRQRIAVVKKIDQDYLGVHRQGDQAEVALLRVRGGHLNQVRTFALRGISLPDDELLSSFVREYYSRAGQVPDEIIVPIALEASDGIGEWLTEMRGRRTTLIAAQRGAKRRLLDMAQENASHAYREKARAKEDIERRLDEVRAKLRLSRVPRRIECLDISHLGGDDTVGAITALNDGQLDRTRYRTFRIKQPAGGDDYGAMRDVLSRRLVRGARDEPGWELPDLLVVDGGKGQLNVARTVTRDLGIDDLQLAALAKEKRVGGESTAVERVYVPDQKNAITLPARSATHHLLTLVRDEAHRVSNRQREGMGKRRRLKSSLDEIAGVGKKTRSRLLKKLGSLKAVMNADVETLRRAGANRRQADAIFRKFHRSTTGESAADAELHALENAFDDA